MTRPQIQKCLHAHHETALPATYWKQATLFFLFLPTFVSESGSLLSFFRNKVLNFKGDQDDCYLFLPLRCYNAGAADVTRPSS